MLVTRVIDSESKLGVGGPTGPTYTLELEMESPHGVQRSDTRAGIKPESS